MIALLLAAAVVGQGVEVGPALAGDALVWGERGSVEGDLRVVRREPDGSRSVLWTFPAPDREDQSVGYQQVPAGLAASSRWVAAAIVDSTDIPTEDDDVSASESVVRLLGAHDGEPPRPLLPGCESAGFGAVAADGDRLAVGASNLLCGGASRSGVYVLDGAAAPRRVRAVPPSAIIPHVAVAGRWLAWGAGTRTRLVDLETDRTVATLAGVERGFAVNRRGDLLFVRRGLRLRRRGGGVRLLARAVQDERVALSGDRVAWVGRHRIHTATRTGRRLRAFERFDGYHRQVRGALSLRGHRLAYAIADSNPGGGDFVPDGRGDVRIVDAG